MIAAIEDAPCVKIYRDIRDGVPEDSLQIGFGYNLFPTSSELLHCLTTMLYNLGTTERLAQYSSNTDTIERELMAQLLKSYLGLSTLKASDIAFTNGSTEAISIIIAYSAQAGYQALLPLPCYYSFEQSAVRWDMPIVGY